MAMEYLNYQTPARYSSSAVHARAWARFTLPDVSSPDSTMWAGRLRARLTFLWKGQILKPFKAVTSAPTKSPTLTPMPAGQISSNGELASHGREMLDNSCW